MNRIGKTALTLCVALMLCACGTASQKTPAMTYIPVETLPPQQNTAAEPVEPEQTQTPVEDAVQSAYAIEYLPQLNSCITVLRNVGMGMFSASTLVYGRFETDQSPDYVMSAFEADQPFYYTDHFINENGWYSLFSDNSGEDPAIILPGELYRGLCFDGADGPSEVIAVDENVLVGDTLYENALVIAVDSMTYGIQVYSVFQRGVGETVRYIPYDEQNLELLSVVSSVEIWEDEQVRQLIEGTVF